MPAPPYSSGMATPARPSSPAWSKNARGNSPVSSISFARGLTTSSANRRTVSCSSFCSSVSSIFMARDRNNPPAGGQGRLSLAQSLDLGAQADDLGLGGLARPGLALPLFLFLLRAAQKLPGGNVLDHQPVPLRREREPQAEGLAQQAPCRVRHDELVGPGRVQPVTEDLERAGEGARDPHQQVLAHPGPLVVAYLVLLVHPPDA